MSSKNKCDVCSRPIHALGETWEVRSEPAGSGAGGMCLIRACPDCGPAIGARPTWYWDENAELVELGLGRLLPMDRYEPFGDYEDELAGLPA